MNICAYQSYFNTAQEKNLQEGFIWYFNPVASIFLESDIIIRLHQQYFSRCADWFGLFSHSVYRKLNGFNYARLEEACNQATKADILAPDPQNYSFCDYIRKPHPIRYTLENKQYETFKVLLKKLKIKENLLKPSHMIYCNYFVAKTNIYKDYINSLLKPAIDLFKNDEELYSLVMRKSHYNNKVPPANYIKDTGLNYYTHAPFILERLINVYIQLNNCNVKRVL